MTNYYGDPAVTAAQAGKGAYSSRAVADAEAQNRVRARAMANAIYMSLGLDPSQDQGTFNTLVGVAAEALSNGTDSVLVGQSMQNAIRASAGMPEPTANASQQTSRPGPGPEAAGPDGGYSYDDLKGYISNYDNLVQVGANGSPYILLKNESGKVVATYERDPETGRYFAVDDVSTGGGSGGSGAGSGPSYMDIQAADLANRTLERNIFESDREFAERTRQYNQNFGENSRQFDTSEKRMNMSDVGQLGVQLGNLNLEQQKHIAQILREPTDFLARAFTQRGGTSPFPEITQADLINKLRTEFDRIRGFTGQEMQTRAGGGMQVPAGQPAGQRINLGGAAPGAGGMAAPGPDSAGFGALGTRYDLQPGYQGLTQDQEVAFHQEGLGAAATQLAAGGDTDVQNWEKVAQDYQNRGYDIPGFEEGTKKGPVKNRISLVGEAGPEILFNHGDGTFDVLDAKKTRILMGDRGAMGEQIEGFRKGTVANDRTNNKKNGFNTGIGDDNPLWRQADKTRYEFAPPGGNKEAPARKTKPAKKAGRAEKLVREVQDDVMLRGIKPLGTVTAVADVPRAIRRKVKGPSKRPAVKGYENGTLDGLTPDVMGRMSLFDVAAVPQTSQQQLLQNAQMATPPGPASVASGMTPPTLDVTKGSSFKLFSPQQYMSLTPDEQGALSTRLASENRSLADFLFSSQKNFAGRPRQQRRARMDVSE